MLLLLCYECIVYTHIFIVKLFRSFFLSYSTACSEMKMTTVLL